MAPRSTVSQAAYANVFQYPGATAGVFPDLAAAIAIAGAKSWAYGAWVQVVLAAAVTVDVWLTELYCTNIVAAGDEYQVDIGSGLVATPPTVVYVARVGTLLTVVTAVGEYSVPGVNVLIWPPVKAPAATPIAARAANAAAGAANGLNVAVAYRTGLA